MSYRELGSTIVILSVLSGCSARTARYAVIPSNPYYLLRYPDGQTRAFPDTTASYSNALDGWVDLEAGMTLKLERAYFEPPESRRIQDYIGLEAIEFRAKMMGGPLRQVEYQPLADRPSGQPSVGSVIPAAQLDSRYHRLFFRTLVNDKSGPAPAVLVSTNSQPDIDAFSKDLIGGLGCRISSRPGAFCTAVSADTTVSVLFGVVANSKLMTVSWGSTVAGLVGTARPIRLWRKHGHRMLPVIFESTDSEALRLPLLPGDVLAFGESIGR